MKNERNETLKTTTTSTIAAQVAKRERRSTITMSDRIRNDPRTRGWRRVRLPFVRNCGLPPIRPSPGVPFEDLAAQIDPCSQQPGAQRPKGEGSGPITLLLMFILFLREWHVFREVTLGSTSFSGRLPTMHNAASTRRESVLWPNHRLP